MSSCFCRRTVGLLAALWLCAAACDQPATADKPSEAKEARRAEDPTRIDRPATNSHVRPDEPADGDTTRWARTAPPAIGTMKTQPRPEHVLRAKERYERLVPRTTLGSWERFENLVYEANNMDMRGPRTHDGRGTYSRNGVSIAATWRKYARGVRALFVLRDSLYSQQDHPYLNDPYAPLLPPNWVTSVAHAAATGESFEPMDLPELEDEAAWRAIDSHEALFGDLPPSESLFEAATVHYESDEPAAAAARAENARRTLHILNRDVHAMAAAIERGPQAVADLGAERIAASDRAYFGPEIRRRHIIPIFVENPDSHELEEGKGVALPGREVSEEVLQTVFRTIYRRRLADGDLAIERYDLSDASDRERAVAVLEAVIPDSGETGAGETGSADSKVWLWVTGKLDPDKKLRGEDARSYIASFRREVEAADVDTSKLELFSKPTVELPPDDGFEATLEREIESFEQLDMPMSINLPTTSTRLRDVICCQD